MAAIASTTIRTARRIAPHGVTRRRAHGDTRAATCARSRADGASCLRRRNAVLRGRAALPATRFDRWAQARDAAMARDERARATSRPYMTGYEDLDANGQWSYDPDYGEVWYPTPVVGRTGRPIATAAGPTCSPWGWTWIDDAPWGYAPFALRPLGLRAQSLGVGSGAARRSSGVGAGARRVGRAVPGRGRRLSARGAAGGLVSARTLGALPTVVSRESPRTRIA